MYRVRRRIKQSNVLVIASQREAIENAFNSIINHRIALEKYIKVHPKFEKALDPVNLKIDAPEVVKLAAGSAEVANVGPMAVIPGALAQLAMESMISTGSTTNVVENGGEIAATSITPLRIGVYAGESILSGKIGFYLSSSDFPVGIATSSATVGHSLDFGCADASVVIADTTSMADAVAKAVSNSVKGNDLELSVQIGLETVEKIGHVRGALIIREKYAGIVGNLPELIRINGTKYEVLAAGLYDLISPNAIIL